MLISAWGWGGGDKKKIRGQDELSETRDSALHVASPVSSLHLPHLFADGALVNEAAAEHLGVKLLEHVLVVNVLEDGHLRDKQ